MEGFTAEQASRFTGCTSHQLRYWDRIDLVKPSVQATGGRPGVRRLYDFRDLVVLRVIRSLLEGGMSLQRVRRAIHYLRRKAGLEEHLSNVKLVTQFLYDRDEFIEALRRVEVGLEQELAPSARARLRLSG